MLKLLIGQEAVGAIKRISDVAGDIAAVFSGPKLRKECDEALRKMETQKNEYEDVIKAATQEFQHASDVQAQKFRNIQLDTHLKVQKAELEAQNLVSGAVYEME